MVYFKKKGERRYGYCNLHDGENIIFPKHHGASICHHGSMSSSKQTGHDKRVT